MAIIEATFELFEFELTQTKWEEQREKRKQEKWNDESTGMSTHLEAREGSFGLLMTSHPPPIRSTSSSESISDSDESR